MKTVYLPDLQAQVSPPKLRKLLDRKDPHVQAWAALALAQVEDHESLPKLRKLLDHKDPNVQRWAAWALGRLEDHESLPKLRKLLDHKDPDVQSSAALALGSLEDHEPLPKIRKLLDHKDPHVQRWALWVVSRLRDHESLPKLRKLLDHKDPHIQAWAALALGRLVDHESLPKLRKLLDHKDLDVQASAASTLAMLRDKAVEPALFRILGEIWLESARAHLSTCLDYVRQPLDTPEKDEMAVYLILCIFHPTAHKNAQWFLGTKRFFLFQTKCSPLIATIQVQKPIIYPTEDDVMWDIAPHILQKATRKRPFKLSLEECTSPLLLDRFLSVVNRELKLLRKGRREREAREDLQFRRHGRGGSIKLHAHSHDLLADGVAHGIREVLQSDLSLDLEYAFKKLSELERRVIETRYKFGMSAKECAKALGLNERTERRHHERGVRKLKSALGEAWSSPNPSIMSPPKLLVGDFQVALAD